jgi:hypothetical protein
VTKAKAKKVTYYMVTRDCCTTGNCGACMAVEGHKFGDKVRCCQIMTEDKELAEKVKKNFQEYKSEVEEPTDANIDRLRDGSAEYVRNWLRSRGEKTDLERPSKVIRKGLKMKAVEVVQFVAAGDEMKAFIMKEFGLTEKQAEYRLACVAYDLIRAINKL